MQANKHDLVLIGSYLGLALSPKATTQQLLDDISHEFQALHQALAWLIPGEQPVGLVPGCKVRLQRFYELARKKKFKGVRPAKGES